MLLSMVTPRAGTLDGTRKTDEKETLFVRKCASQHVKSDFFNKNSNANQSLFYLVCIHLGLCKLENEVLKGAKNDPK